MFLTIYLDVPAIIFPAWIVRYFVLIPQAKIAKGTVDGVCLAMRYSWAINLDGGHTHATKSCGNMFNVYPDISLAIHYARKWHRNKANRIMVINTSCSQANGVLRDFHEDEGVHICDVFDPTVEPKDTKSYPGIDTQINVGSNDDDDSYISKIMHKVNLALSTFGPDFVIYNAGYDIMEGDKIGKMRISDSTVMLRDELIFREVYEDQNVPILMTVGGCHQKNQEQVISRSIRNIIIKFDLSPKQLSISSAYNIRNAQKLQNKQSRYDSQESGFAAGGYASIGRTVKGNLTDANKGFRGTKKEDKDGNTNRPQRNNTVQFEEDHHIVNSDAVYVYKYNYYIGTIKS
jgi:acetoin utilization deacetylase AcuC-like enzyme